MLRFLSPFWLISLLAVAVPVAIHLLSRKAGRKIKVGSIRFLEASASHRLKSLKLSEIPLLLLRIALIAALALLLAQPRWLTKPHEAETMPRGWVLVTPEILFNLGRAHHQLIDSLAAAGSELHLFTVGFPSFKLSDSATRQRTEENLWSLLREVDRLAPQTPLWIFSPNRLTSVRGERPALQPTVNWHAVPSTQRNRWIQEARLTPNDSLFVVIGASDAEQIVLARYDLKAPAQRMILSNPDMPVLEAIPPHQKRMYALRLVEQDTNPADNHFEILPDSDRVTVAILHDSQRRDDARYVQSALEAVAEFNRMSIDIKMCPIRGNEQSSMSFDVAFWLSEQPLSEAWHERITQGLILISDAGGMPYEQSESWMVMSDVSLENIPRLRRRVAPIRQGLSLWTDGFGEPLLECERRGKGWHYRFYSRFHPAWNDLVLSPVFPEWALSLLQRDNSIAPGSDQRRISAAQLLPAQKTVARASLPDAASHPLHIPFWILAAILFGLERWMAERKLP